MLTNRISKPLFCVLCMGLLFLISCQPTPVSVDQTPVNIAPDVTSVDAAPNLVLPVEFAIQNRCPNISPQFVPSDRIGGILYMRERVGLITLLNLQNGEQESLGSVGNLDVSPNRMRLAYFELDENTLSWSLVVQMLDGGPTKIKLPTLDGALRMSGWHDNEHLLFQMVGDTATNPAPNTIMILNPLNGEKKTHILDFPNIDNGVEWGFSWSAAYSQDMDYVLYAGIKENTDNVHEYVLWSNASKSKIISLPGSSYKDFYLYAGEIIQLDGVRANSPQWDPDDSRVLIISPASADRIEVDEIFAITKNGDVQRLTYFENHFEKVQISKMSWSPDGKNIAFWTALDPRVFDPEPGAYQDIRLAILDTETLDVTFYCISGDSIGLTNGPPSAKFISNDIPAPIWSPTGQQVIVENRYTSDASRLILLDIQKEVAVQVGENMKPIGWMMDK